MSSKASLIPKRAARARALGRSVSQMAWTSTLRIFFSTGRCATWAMAPPPMMPTLRRSVLAPLRLAVMEPPSSVAALQSSSRKVGGQNLLGRLAGPRPPDGAPLTKPHPMPCPHTVDNQAGHPVLRHGGDQVEGRALQWLARAGTHYLSDRRAIDPDLRPTQPNCELIHTSG